MKPDEWQKIQFLFHAALEIPFDERTAFLDRECGSDAALRAAVEKLLRNDPLAGDFLDAALRAGAESLALEQENSMEGRLVGPYKIKRRIGEGGLSTVYLAVRSDDQYQKRVALKLVKRGMDTEDILRRFRMERQILAGLDHPNIARLLDGGTTEEGLPYFAMEYIEGVPIDEYCDSHKLPVNARLELFCTVCSAVHSAHQNLVIHRDPHRTTRIRAELLPPFSPAPAARRATYTPEATRRPRPSLPSQTRSCAPADHAPS